MVGDEKSVLERLQDAPRSGSPPKFTAEQLTHLFAIACEDPRESGRPISHWTNRELADELVKRNIVESISPRHVGRLLDEPDLKPHKIRYWLTPSDDEDFDEKVRDISELYITAPERAKQGEQTLSTDEMTGVQALERKAPDLPLAPHLMISLRAHSFLNPNSESLQFLNYQNYSLQEKFAFAALMHQPVFQKSRTCSSNPIQVYMSHSENLPRADQ